jgi:hypothetical protein
MKLRNTNAVSINGKYPEIFPNKIGEDLPHFTMRNIRLFLKYKSYPIE